MTDPEPAGGHLRALLIVLGVIVVLIAAAAVVGIVFIARAGSLKTGQGTAIGGAAAAAAALIAAVVSFGLGWLNRQSLEKQIDANRTTAEKQITQAQAALRETTDLQGQQLQQQRDQATTERDFAVRRNLRDRFTTAAAQLGDDAVPVRMAGVYAMAALADDWIRYGQAHAQHEEGSA